MATLVENLLLIVGSVFVAIGLTRVADIYGVQPPFLIGIGILLLAFYKPIGRRLRGRMRPFLIIFGTLLLLAALINSIGIY